MAWWSAVFCSRVFLRLSRPICNQLTNNGLVPVISLEFIHHPEFLWKFLFRRNKFCGNSGYLLCLFWVLMARVDTVVAATLVVPWLQCMSRCLTICACRFIIIQLLGPPGPRKLTFDQVFASSRFVIFVAVRLQPEWIQVFASLWFSFHFWGGSFGGGGSFYITAFGRALFLLAAGFVQRQIHIFSDKTVWTFFARKIVKTLSRLL